MWTDPVDPFPSLEMIPDFLRVLCLLIFLTLGFACCADCQQPCPASPELEEPVSTLTIHADSQRKIKDMYYLRGHVLMTYKDMRMSADRVDFNNATGDVVARGHVVFDDPKGHLEAPEAHYNVNTEKGYFLHAHGYIQNMMKSNKRELVTNTPYYVRAQEIDRIGPDLYTVHRASLSACQRESTGWSLYVGSAKLEVGNEMSSHWAIFRFLRLPLFILPDASHSINGNLRHTGFLLPHVGQDSQKGFVIGDGFYWAINPSSDLLLGLEDYSYRGVAEDARFRARPSATSNLTADIFHINDHGSGPLRQVRAPGESVDVTGDADNFLDGFRGVVDVDYINSLAFRTTWSDTFNAAVFSEAHQTGFLSKNFDAYSLNIYTDRYQDFLSAAPNDLQSIIISQVPSFSFSGSDKQIGQSPFLFSFDSSASGVARSEPGFTTPPLSARVDFFPHLTVRTKPLWGFHLTPTLGIRETYYGTSLAPGGAPVNRFLGQVTADLRPPSFEKVFSHPFLGHRFKHVIEPDIQYNLIKSPSYGNIQNILRFDQSDVWTETNELDFSVNNTILMKKADRSKENEDGKHGSETSSNARDLISWQLSERYFFDPTFGGVVTPGSTVAIEPTLALTGFAFPEGHPYSPLDSVLKFAPFSNYDTELVTDFDPHGGQVLDAGVSSRIHRGDLSLGVTDFFTNHTELLPSPLVPDVPISQLPTFNLLTTQATYGNIQSKGLTGSVRVDYNLAQGIAQDFAIRLRYNFGCFAINVEFQRFNLGFLRNESFFRSSLSLANIGTLGNLNPAEPLP
ncbi:MAG TPA: LPS assembly protein LptD [Terriglobia bacterium]|nr:LPS assembly protein LptD [Terriglobia bacterium]